MGNTDRSIRVILAVFAGVLFFTNTISGTFGIILLIIAAVLILTSLFGFCPLYAPFGLSTCSVKKAG